MGAACGVASQPAPEEPASAGPPPTAAAQAKQLATPQASDPPSGAEPARAEPEEHGELLEAFEDWADEFGEECDLEGEAEDGEEGVAKRGTEDGAITVKVVEGEEFMAVKPWLGQLFAPTGQEMPSTPAGPPAIQLEVEHVYGYRAHDTRMNAFYNTEVALPP
jgi:hypothetical protein